MNFFQRIFKRPNQPEAELAVEGDLTAAVTAARRGLKRDVAALIAALPKGALYAPLGAEIPGMPQGVITKPGRGTPVSTQILFDPKGARFGVFFTRPEFLAAFGARSRWQTGGGALRYVGMSGPDALGLHREAFEKRQLAGIVINPGQPEELSLNAEEAGSLAKGEPVPLERYVGDLPLQPGEKFECHAARTPPPAELLQAVTNFVDRDARVAGFVFLESFMPERHRRPHPLLMLKPFGQGIDQPAVVRDLKFALKTVLPPDEYIDILFGAAD